MSEEYPENSNKSKEPKKRPEVLAVTTAVERKKPLMSRVADSFKGDDLHSVGHYVLFDILLPAAKSMLSDMVSNGIERLLFGGTPRPGGRYGSGQTNYRGYATNPVTASTSPAQRAVSAPGQLDRGYDNIVLPSRVDAERVLDALTELIRQYEAATISDLYSLVGITEQYTDTKWGWFNLSEATVRPVREGYLLIVPNPVELDRQ